MGDRSPHADLAIARKLLDGDETTFRAVFDGYFPRLYRFALSRTAGNEETARDIVQQTFCKAFQQLQSYRGEASLYGWMVQIGRNTLIDRARHLSTRPTHLTLQEDDDILQAMAEAIRTTDFDGPEERLERLDLLQIIQATLDYLPSHYGDALEWKYVEGRTVNEIADRLEIGYKAAESLLTRARRAFREAIVTLVDSADLLPIDIRNRNKGKDYV
jgi:RNA polymerase sigma-70 factor (ECF subfamily)